MNLENGCNNLQNPGTEKLPNSK